MDREKFESVTLSLTVAVEFLKGLPLEEYLDTLQDTKQMDVLLAGHRLLWPSRDALSGALYDVGCAANVLIVRHRMARKLARRQAKRAAIAPLPLAESAFAQAHAHQGTKE